MGHKGKADLRTHRRLRFAQIRRPAWTPKMSWCRRAHTSRRRHTTATPSCHASRSAASRHACPSILHNRDRVGRKEREQCPTLPFSACWEIYPFSPSPPPPLLPLLFVRCVRALYSGSFAYARGWELTDWPCRGADVVPGRRACSPPLVTALFHSHARLRRACARGLAIG